MRQHLGDIFPKLCFNYTDVKTYEKYAELKNIIHQYGNNFKVLPGMAMANYITNTTPILTADWMLGNEYNFDADFFVKDFLNKKPYIIYEKQTMFTYNSNITSEIIKHCDLVTDYEHFKIYKAKPSPRK